MALRTLRKSRAFLLVAVVSLELGIGANTAIFSLTDQVLLRLLPVKDPRQLVLLWGRGQHYGSNNGRYRLSYPMYADFRDKNKVLSGMFCRWESESRLDICGCGREVSWLEGPPQMATQRSIPSRTAGTRYAGRLDTGFTQGALKNSAGKRPCVSGAWTDQLARGILLDRMPDPTNRPA